MPKFFYTEMARHALRYRCKCPKGPKRDKDTWSAADTALNRLSDYDREAMVSIYTSTLTVPDAIQKLCDSGYDHNRLWATVSRIERSVAKAMGWIHS